MIPEKPLRTYFATENRSETIERILRGFSTKGGVSDPLLAEGFLFASRFFPEVSGLPGFSPEILTYLQGLTANLNVLQKFKYFPGHTIG